MMVLKNGREKHSMSKHRYARACNLCGDVFVATVPHRCFCRSCKASSDLYRFHDWLPEAPGEMSDTAGAMTVPEIAKAA